VTLTRHNNAAQSTDQTIITQLEETVALQARLISELLSRVEQLEEERDSRLIQLEKSMEAMDSKSRKCNVIVRGLAEGWRESKSILWSKVTGLICQGLHNHDAIPSQAERLGKRYQGRTRPVRLTFPSVAIRDSVMRTKNRLAHSVQYHSIQIIPDEPKQRLSPAQRQRKLQPAAAATIDPRFCMKDPKPSTRTQPDSTLNQASDNGLQDPGQNLPPKHGRLYTLAGYAKAARLAALAAANAQENEITNTEASNTTIPEANNVKELLRSTEISNPDEATGVDPFEDSTIE